MVWRPVKSYCFLTKQILWIFALTTCVNLKTGHGNEINEEVQTTTVFGLHADYNLNWETNIKYVILNVSSAYHAGEDSHHS
jgi:hypothetical protein